MRILDGLFAMAVLLALYLCVPGLSSCDNAVVVVACWEFICFLHLSWFLCTRPNIPFVVRLVTPMPLLGMMVFAAVGLDSYLKGIIGSQLIPLVLLTQLAAFGDAIFCVLKLSRSMPQSISARRRCITASPASAAIAPVTEIDSAQT